MIETGKQIYFFGDFELNGAKRLLLKKGEIVSLHSKSLDLLLTLINNHGQILSKDELLETVWKNQFVEENNLTVQISALRKVFGEQKGEHQFIATVPGKGYKFVADIRLAQGDEDNAKYGLSVNLAIPDKLSNYSGDTLTVSKESLIGRTREIAEIRSFLQLTGSGLMTLTGAGGSGKTSLAQAVADELKTDFPDGVFFIELAAALKPETVVSAVAQSLNIKETGDKTLIEIIRDFLRMRRILLILDNFEQVLAAAPFIREILKEAAALKILITSRAALRIKNEREFSVLPLKFPPEDEALSINELAEYPAIELFCRRARIIKTNFVLTNENIHFISAICHRLDGLPLAIELAAVRVKLFSPQAILHRLSDSLKLLTSGAKDCPARQRTMRDTIQWSYDLLLEDEKTLFRQLAVFAGGFTVEAAEAIANGENIKARSEPENPSKSSQSPYIQTSVLDLLSSLIDNNLVVAKEQPDGNIRLRMLEVVREFALECLEESGEGEIIRKKHAEFFLEFAEEAELLLDREQSADCLENLELEHDNLRAALRWLFEKQPETAVRMTTVLRRFWTNRAYQTEAHKWIGMALKESHKPSVTRIKLLNSFSLLARNQGNYELAKQTAEESLAASRKIKNLPQTILSCHAMAGLESKEGRFSNAQKLLEEALAMSRKSDDKKQIAYALASLGDLFLAQTKLSAARPVIEEALAICRQFGFKLNESINLINLGTVAYYEGDAETAFRYFSESLIISCEMGNKISISCCLDGFAAVAVMSGNPGQAGFLAGMSESLRQSIDYEIEITERRFCEDYLEKVCAALGEKDFAAVYAQGKTLNLNEILAHLVKKKELLHNRNAGEIFMEGFYPPEEITEIIIENHKIERIIINEEI